MPHTPKSGAFFESREASAGFSLQGLLRQKGRALAKGGFSMECFPLKPSSSKSYR